MEFRKGHQGVDQIELLPEWIWRTELLKRSFFTYKMDDQKIGRGPVVLVFQKEVLW